MCCLFKCCSIADSPTPHIGLLCNGLIDGIESSNIKSEQTDEYYVCNIRHSSEDWSG